MSHAFSRSRITRAGSRHDSHTRTLTVSTHITSINPLAILDKEHVRSSVLVTPFDMFPPKAAWYATRAQSVLLVRRSSSPEVTFAERQAYTLDAQEAAAAPVWSGKQREWTFTVSA